MVRVKICGITNMQDAGSAVEGGADALGFVFYSSSKRYIEPEEAGEIITSLPPFVTPVGVFVNAPLDEITRIQSVARFQICQLHGDEPPQFCASLPMKTIKAIRVADKLDTDELASYPVAALLFDTRSEQGYGGTGMSFDWKLLNGVESPKPVILSGGLTPVNVAAAIEAVRPYGVDVSSGVEEYPGKKDHLKIKKFIEAAKNENRP
ncbi:MAG: phosphoribosylanthranilate isomerase [Candidatus Dadabacteria bacterium]|nr:phosphoribosylanthranilate isomerase [Candidatus Dadabacteria bacterium]